MKSILVCFALICILAFCKNAPIFSSNSYHTSSVQANDVIIPGKGYSTDREQVPVIVCYNVKALPITKAESIVHFQQGMSFRDMQEQMKIDVSTNVNIGLFKAGLDVGYMRSIQDTDFSLSMNYFQKIQAQVQQEIYYGLEALSATGLQIYQNGNNPYFGQLCGDKLISSYKTGAILMLSLKVQFHSSQQKTTFTSHFGVSFGSLMSITTDIKKTCQNYQLNGKIIVQAYQLGGNPSQLAKILDQKCGDHYCAAACNITSIDSCVGVIDGLLKYASGSFPTQVSVADNRGLSAFPIGFATLTDLKWIGLKPPKSIVTPQIKAARLNLARALNETSFYFAKLDAIINKYPVIFPLQNLPTYTELKDLHITSSNLLKAIMNQDGALSCYDDPQECLDTARDLINRNANLRSKVIQSEALQNMKYKYLFNLCSYLYPAGDNNLGNVLHLGSCTPVIPNCQQQKCLAYWGYYGGDISNTNWSADPPTLTYIFHINSTAGYHQWNTINKPMTLSANKQYFQGQTMHIHPTKGAIVQNFATILEDNQYYFTAFQHPNQFREKKTQIVATQVQNLFQKI